MNNSFSLSIISPVFIGNNNSLSPNVNFFYQDNKIHYLSPDNLASQLTDEQVDQFLNYVTQNRTGRNNNPDLFNFFTSVDINPIKLISNSIPCYVNIKNRNIREFVNSCNRIFIPGSSIKGVIRTSILYNYLKHSTSGQDSIHVFLRKFKAASNQFLKRRKDISHLESKRKYEHNTNVKRNIKYQIDEIIKPVKQKINNLLRIMENDLYGSDSDNDFMKNVVISDSNNVRKSDYIQIEELIRLRLKDKKPIGPPQLFEMLKENSKFEFNIILKESGPSIYNSGYFNNLTIQNIFRLINIFSRDQIKAEQNLYKEDKYYSKIKSFNYNLLEQSGIQNVLIRLGANKTFLFNTVVNLLPEEDFILLREILRIGENPFTGELAKERFPSSQRFIIRDKQSFIVPGWCILNSFK